MAYKKCLRCSSTRSCHFAFPAQRQPLARRSHAKQKDLETQASEKKCQADRTAKRHEQHRISSLKITSQKDGVTKGHSQLLDARVEYCSVQG
mmetsp:Transcript_7882/g.21696  ORF Transcript_7882/g.21696 Transcript_7882/m.21696 type:complete len:92 (+) Transcript_7882:84-359(+)